MTWGMNSSSAAIRRRLAESDPAWARALYRKARGATMDEVMQKCADHGINAHNMKGFGPELYLKMRKCVRMVDEA